MENSVPVVANGLKGIISTKTNIAEVDGQNGKLTIRGYDISELSGSVEFEELCYLLWHETLPNKAQYAEFKTEMAALRPLPAPVLTALTTIAPYAQGMDILRIGAAMLSVDDPDLASLDPQICLRRAMRLQAQMPVIVAAGYRLNRGLQPIAPKPEQSLAASFLYMLEGEEPDPARVAGLNAYLVAVSEHGLNASTFAGRTIISTNSDMVSALTGAIGALNGWLHGGVPGPVLDMLEEIGTAENAEPWVRAALTQKKRIMGFGHRIYKVRDPRATLLADAAERMAAMTGDRHLLNMTKSVEETVVRVLEEEKPGRGLRANVELYAALILHAVAIPSEIFTPVFAIGRTSGWMAHFLEQIPLQTIIRPDSIYDGPKDRKYVPIENR